ncbi:very short patch repair endonuclease [Pseudomonas putida]|uniref:very short patch repair endonuclease n=1 Tax=Pseudomonas putida TaxID=303 RepID=UPI000374096A|nr:very short patch repair endonuclease [Pseudomonas putida]
MCADIVSPAQRSSIMRRIRGKDTKPEIIVRSTCHAMGLRFRLHRRDLPGSPDLVFPKFHLCLFVHGCFWHRHPNCRYAYTPKSRSEFWLSKLSRNAERDLEVQKALRSLGWSTEVIWECETKDLERLHRRLESIFS